MTDTRLPGQWLNSIKFDNLSDAAWRVFTNAMMWCNESGTDGFLPERYLSRTHPDGVLLGAIAEVEQSGLWARVEGGYRFNDWDGALGQSTAERVELQREQWRQRSRAKRAREKENLARALGVELSDPQKSGRSATRDVREGRPSVTSTGGVGTGPGQGQGQGPASDETDSSDGILSAEGQSQKLNWDVAPIPE